MSSSVEIAQSCTQDGCPFGKTGECLEGFAGGEGCPNVTSAAPDSAAAEGAPEVEYDVTDVTDTPTPMTDIAPSRLIELGGDESLSVQEADLVAADESATVVLLAGEFECGKTTLITELYAQFLRGGFEEWTFGGSRTLIALDERHKLARATSGLSEPDTPRTGNEDMRLLHLRIQSSGNRFTFLTTDVKGEMFEHVIDGIPVAAEVPIASRADRVLVLLDGNRIKDVFDRQVVTTRTRQLIGGLTEAGGIRRETPTAVVLTKADLLSEDELDWCMGELHTLADFAVSRGMDSQVIVTSARPTDSAAAPIGFEDVLRFLGPRASGGHAPADGIRDSAPKRIFWSLDDRGAHTRA